MIKTVLQTRITYFTLFFPNVYLVFVWISILTYSLYFVKIYQDINQDISRRITINQHISRYEYKSWSCRICFHLFFISLYFAKLVCFKIIILNPKFLKSYDVIQKEIANDLQRTEILISMSFEVITYHKLYNVSNALKQKVQGSISIV